MCVIDDAEPVTMLREDLPTARKIHQCSECRRMIIPGETYRCEVFIFEGRRSTHKTCPHCMVLRDWLQGECSGFIFGAVKEDFEEHLESHGHIDMQRVGVMSRRRWMRPGRGLYPVPARPKTTHERILDFGPPRPYRLRREY